MKKFLPMAAILLALIAGFWLFTGTPDPIEDTNGPEDCSLTTITRENIVNQDMGARNPISVREGRFEIAGITISNGVKFSSKDFTGVYQVMYGNFFLNSDVVISLHDFVVEEGNFQMSVIYNDEIVAILEPGETVEYRMEDVNGTVSLVIAGESASYRFMMFRSDYDMFSHP